MAFTAQQVCDRARTFLNDADKVRVPDATLLQYVNDAILVLSVNRPDLFLGSYKDLPKGDLALAGEIPLEDRFIPAVADWVVARAESIEDEYTVDGRAAAFMTLAGISVGGQK